MIQHRPEALRRHSGQLLRRQQHLVSGVVALALGFVARRCGVTMCLQLRRRQQVIRLGSSGCVRRDQHGSSTSQRINLWYQYSIAMGMLIVLTIFFTRLQDWSIEFRGLLSSPRGKLSIQMSLDSGV